MRYSDPLKSTVTTTMSNTSERIPIVRGISMTHAGEVTVEPELDEALCDLAIALQDDDSPIDVEHIVAALILASRAGHIPSDYQLKANDKPLRSLLKPHVRLIFQRYGGEVCEEE